MRRALARSLIPILLAVQLAACTNKQAFVTVGVTVHTVDVAMSAWADYVVAQAKVAGVAPQAWNVPKQAQVKQVFQTYQDAATVARTALLVSNQMPTPADLASAAAAVVDIVQTITGKKVTP
jgi:hypothetical protein